MHDARFGDGVTLPYLDDGGQCNAIQRRWLLPPAGVAKTRIMGKVAGAVFGAHCCGGGDILAVAEGEINAVSVWQGTNIDAVAIGSQYMARNAATLSALDAVTSRYKRIIIWLDDAAIVAALAARYSTPIAISSNQAGAVVAGKIDANDMLVGGYLREFLAHYLA